VFEAVKDLLRSKKALMAIATMIVAAGGKLGLDLNADELLPILAPLMAYVVGQGIADSGKEAAKIKNGTGKE